MFIKSINYTVMDCPVNNLVNRCSEYTAEVLQIQLNSLLNSSRIRIQSTRWSDFKPISSDENNTWIISMKKSREKSKNTEFLSWFTLPQGLRPVLCQTSKDLH